MKTQFAFTALSLLPLITAQAVNFCTDDKCGACPSSITTSGTGYPTCVIYDTETVFGGQGFEEGAGSIIYEVFGSFPDPGPNCNTMIRSPASLTQNGCGNLIQETNSATCSSKLGLQSSFMVQFCCGEGDCTAAGVPFKRSAVGGHTMRPREGLGGGVYLKFANGTVIEPIAVGSPPDTASKRDDCDSYAADGDPYLTTKDTQIVSATLGPFPEDTTIVNTYEQTVTTTTSFSASISDPFGIVSVSTSIEFSDAHATGVQYSVPVLEGQAGRVGFTPVYRCTKGTITPCSGDSSAGEACTPYVLDGIVQGDYTLVAS